MITLTITIEEQQGGVVLTQMRPTEDKVTDQEDDVANMLCCAVNAILKANIAINGKGLALTANDEEGMKSAMRIAGFKDGKPPKL